MNLTAVLTQFKTVQTDIQDGKFLKALEDTQPIQQMFIDLGRSVGFQAGPDDEATCKEIATCINDCCALIKHPPVSSEPTNKIGDGHILQALDNLFTLFTKWAPEILPLIIPFLKP